MFKDENGLPVALDGDGGDTLQRSGAWAAGFMIRSQKPTAFADLVVTHCYLGHGKWRRHPDDIGSPPFWSDPNFISRDQLINAFIIARLAKQLTALTATTCRVLLRFGFAPNWDQMIAQSSLIIRCWFPLSLVLWPVLFVTDLFLVFGAIAEIIPYRWKHEARRFVHRNPNDADVDNAVVQYFIAWYWMPTPFSWLARMIHSGFMMKTEGSLSMGIKNRLAGAMAWKHRPEAYGDKGLAELWRGWLEEFTWTR